MTNNNCRKFIPSLWLVSSPLEFVVVSIELDVLYFYPQFYSPLLLHYYLNNF
jgi:hypothetical protein